MTDFRAGDTVKVYYKVKEGNQVRLQPFEGVVLSIRGEGDSKTFTVRRLGSENIGVERIFPLESPNLERVEVLEEGHGRRSKYYFLRKLSNKEVRRKLSKS